MSSLSGNYDIVTAGPWSEDKRPLLDNLKPAVIKHIGSLGVNVSENALLLNVLQTNEMPIGIYDEFRAHIQSMVNVDLLVENDDQAYGISETANYRLHMHETFGLPISRSYAPVIKPETADALQAPSKDSTPNVAIREQTESLRLIKAARFSTKLLGGVQKIMQSLGDDQRLETVCETGAEQIGVNVEEFSAMVNNLVDAKMLFRQKKATDTMLRLEKPKPAGRASQSEKTILKDKPVSKKKATTTKRSKRA
jgi:hypothetical protein